MTEWNAPPVSTTTTLVPSFAKNAVQSSRARRDRLPITRPNILPAGPGGMASGLGSLLRHPYQPGSPFRGHGRSNHRRQHHVLFGAPIAHEEHARRACYAAHDLRTCADEVRIEHGVDFGVRIGLNSGEVVVGKIGDDLRMDSPSASLSAWNTLPDPVTFS